MIKVQSPAQLDDIGAVGGLKREAFRAGFHDRSRLGGNLGILVLDLKLALENFYARLLLLEAVEQGLNAGVIICNCCPERQQRRCDSYPDRARLHTGFLLMTSLGFAVGKAPSEWAIS